MLAHIRAIDKKAGGLQVLLALSVSPELQLSELYRQIRLDRATVRRAVETLASAGLVERFEVGRFPFVKRVHLTTFGARVTSAPLNNWPALFFENQTTLKLDVSGTAKTLRTAAVKNELVGRPVMVPSMSTTHKRQGRTR